MILDGKDRDGLVLVRRSNATNIADNIKSNNDELESMSGNVELLKDSSITPDNKIIELEKLNNAIFHQA